MADSSNTDAVSAVGAVSGSSSSSYDAIAQAQTAYQIQELEAKAKESKKSGSENSPVEQDWGFSGEETHKLYENLCNAFVNQCKEDQDRMKEALQELQQSTSTGN